MQPAIRRPKCWTVGAELKRVVGPEGRVYAFEPDPDTREALRRSSVINGFTQLEACQVALSDHAGECAFHRAKDYGVSHAGLIAEREAPLLGLDPGYCRRYLDTLIRYDLGPDERAGMERYRELVAELDVARPKVPRTSLADSADANAEGLGDGIRSDDVEGFTGRK